MSAPLCLQIASTATRIPSQDEFKVWINNSLQFTDNKSINIRIVDEEEMTALNRQYRRKNQPTNVLSFPLQLPKGVGAEELGDIVICAPVVQAEAQRQHKSELAHWAHMTIHGVLHLVGYDHLLDAEAEQMEAIEIQWLAELGYRDPYVDED